VLLIDEIENGVHWSVLEKMWRSIGDAAKQYNCQIIATTHSDECLQSAHKGLEMFSNDFHYIRLDRKEDEFIGITFNYHMFGEAITSNMEVR
ncbi:MAG: AAA family ATPase, partial [Planctomycetota bacterium]